MKKKIIGIFFATLTLAPFAVAQKRSITEKDMFDFVWIGDPHIPADPSEPFALETGLGK